MEEREKRRPWERRPDESEKAFEAFSLYRDMGSKRTIAAVAEKLQKSRQLIQRWQKRYEWAARINAYDNDIEKKAHEALKKEAVEIRKTHLQIAAQLELKALKALNLLQPEEMGPKDIKEMLKLALEVEQRLVLESAGRENHYEPLDDGFLEALAGAAQAAFPDGDDSDTLPAADDTEEDMEEEA